MRRSVSLMIAIVLVPVMIAAVFAVGGSPSDPLISVSALTGLFNTPVYSYLQQRADLLKADALASFETSLNEYIRSKLDENAVNGMIFDAAAELAARQVMERLGSDPSSLSAAVTVVTAKRGERIVGNAGSGFILTSGAGKIYAPSGGSVINITTGSLRYNDFVIRDGIYYMMTSSGNSGLEITSESATVMLLDGARIAKSVAVDIAEKHADALYSLALFYGTGQGYELERIPTRAEALVMLVRLLGEASEARAHADDSPFTDLAGWENRYVSFAYEKRYTAGTSATTFSPTQPSSLDMYLSFVLRALGYTGDFVWDQTSRSFALSIGLISQEHLDSIAVNGFTRGDMVIISYNALFVNIKGAGQTLGDRLISQGVITPEGLAAAAEYVK